MPERDNLNSAAVDAIVKVIANSGEMKVANAGCADGRKRRPDQRLRAQ